MDKKKKDDKKSEKESRGPNKYIETNPTISEASDKKIVIAWGRMNPPTAGHEKLVNTLKAIAKREGAAAEVYLSHSQDAKKNPLSYDDKINLAQLAFGSVVKKLPAKTIIDVMRHLSGKYGSIILVTGEDRVKEFDTLLNKYNGKEFTFASIEVVSAGDRDPDSDGVEGMSASKMRSAASSGDEAQFKSGLPSKLKNHADDVYNLVRTGMQLSEELEDLDEAVLNYSQRRKRALVMKRYERKMQAARERLKMRVGDQKRLLGRARKKAIALIRRRVAGEKGANYADLSPAEKQMIDARVEKRKKLIGKIATRLLPTVRKADRMRVQSLHAHSHDQKNEEFEAFLESKRPHMMRTKDGKMKYDRRFKAFRHINEADDAEILNAIDEAWNEIHDIAASVKLDEQKLESDLREKARKAGVPFKTIKEMFDQGLKDRRENQTPQQSGYAKVNAFINARFDEAFGHAHIPHNISPVQVPHPDHDEEPDPKQVALNAAKHIKGALERKDKTQKIRTYHEEHGAGDEGTKKVVKRYKKDTPCESVNESFENMLSELSKPSVIKSFRDQVKGIDKVDSRDKGWSSTLPDAMSKFGFKLLGAGKYASVFGNPKYPFVLKVFMKDSAYLRWIKFAMENPSNPYVPRVRGKVIKITPVIYAMRLEKLTPGSFTGPFAQAYNKWMRDSSFKSDDKNIQDILDFFGPNKDLLDLHGENIMMRGDQLVVIDPFYNWFGKKNPGAYTIDPDDIHPSVFGLREETLDESTEITMSQMKDFEKFVDRMFEKFKIDFDFTNHFGDRMNDDRNSPKITLKELAELIKKIYAKNGNPLKGKAGSELVVKDIQSDLNMPIVVKYDEKNDEIDVVAKTIMRKKNFSTSNPVVKY